MRDENTLADRIVYALEKREMSQADLARKSGLSTAVVAQIVTGKTKDPQLTTVVKIATALGVSLNYLAGLTDYMVVALGDDDEG